MRREFVLSLVLSACTPRACSEEDEVIERELKVLIEREGRDVQIARHRLERRGPSVIAILETGLYRADAKGRLRIVQVLGALGEEARPILEHLVRHDVSALVREGAITALAGTKGAQEKQGD